MIGNFLLVFSSLLAIFIMKRVKDKSFKMSVFLFVLLFLVMLFSKNNLIGGASGFIAYGIITSVLFLVSFAKMISKRNGYIDVTFLFILLLDFVTKYMNWPAYDFWFYVKITAMLFFCFLFYKHVFSVKSKVELLSIPFFTSIILMMYLLQLF
jgi:hypothetical protein